MLNDDDSDGYVLEDGIMTGREVCSGKVDWSYNGGCGIAEMTPSPLQKGVNGY